MPLSNQVFRFKDLFEVRHILAYEGCERPHRHDHLVISSITQGEILLQINTRQTRLDAQSVLAIGPNILHNIQQYSQKQTEFYVLEVFTLPTGSLPPFENLHLQFFQTLHWQKPSHHHDFTTLCRFLLGTHPEQDKQHHYEHWLNALLHHRFPSLSVPAGSKYRLAATIKSALDAYESTSPDYDAIAQTIQKSKVYCNRIFKQAYGISMQSYFLSHKAETARNQLLHSTASLADIALDCGFYDQSHFTKVFKEIFQVTPATYREMVQQAAD